MPSLRDAERRAAKAVFADALEEMLKTHSFSDISVQDIVESCGVSRTTFYRHFKDKYDLMQWVYLRQLEKIYARHPDLSEWRKPTQEILQFIQENKAFFKNVVSYDKQNSLLELIRNLSIDDCTVHLLRELNAETLPDEMAFAVELFAIGSSNMVASWIAGGMTISAQMLANRICDCIPKVIGQYFS